MIDAELEFSDSQAITATAASTNVVDATNLGDLGAGQFLPLEVSVKEAFNTLTSLDVAIQESADAAFTTPITLLSQNLLLAALTLNKRLNYNVVPHTANGYIRMLYTVNGANPTLGKISAAVVTGKQTNLTP